MAWNTMAAWLLVTAIPAAKVPAAPAASAVVLRVYDAAGLGGPHIHAVVTLATRVLGRAGVVSTWVTCTVTADSERRDGPCWREPDALTINIRLLPGLSHLSPAVCGDAVLPAQAARPGQLATVYAECTTDVSHLYVVPRDTVLAFVVVHEVGHLLLSHPVHATDGIMSSVLGATAWRRAAAGRLWFTPEEAARLRAGVASRVAASLSARAGGLD